MSDKQLIEGIRKGDHAAFGYLYERYAPRLRNFAVSFIKDDDAADDIVQEGFIRIWVHRSSLAWTSPSSFLFIIIRNLCLNYLKHKAILPLDDINDESRAFEDLYILDTGSDTDEPILVDELRQLIEVAVNKMPERTRIIFCMSKIKGLNNKEIAQKLNISATAVGNNLEKAIKIIDKYIKTEN